jgi:hypothetical protein
VCWQWHALHTCIVNDVLERWTIFPITITNEIVSGLEKTCMAKIFERTIFSEIMIPPCVLKTLMRPCGGFRKYLPALVDSLRAMDSSRAF